MELKRYRMAIEWVDTKCQYDAPRPHLIEDENGDIVMYADMVKMLHTHFFPEAGFNE